MTDDRTSEVHFRATPSPAKPEQKNAGFWALEDSPLDEPALTPDKASPTPLNWLSYSCQRAELLGAQTTNNLLQNLLYRKTHHRHLPAIASPIMAQLSAASCRRRRATKPPQGTLGRRCANPRTPKTTDKARTSRRTTNKTWNNLQQTAYQNTFADVDQFRNSMAPGLMDFANRLMARTTAGAVRRSARRALA